MVFKSLDIFFFYLRNGSSISQREAPEQTVGSCMGYLNEQGRVEEGINANIIGEAGMVLEKTSTLNFKRWFYCKTELFKPYLMDILSIQGEAGH